MPDSGDDSQALVPVTRSAAAPAEAATIVDATVSRPPIRLLVGDVVFLLDGDRLERLIRAGMPAEIGGARDMRQAAAERGLDMVLLGLRGAAVAALPVVRKLMALWAPNYPPPSPPRRSDVLAYLVGYFVTLARDIAERQDWRIDVSETEAGDIEIHGIHPAAPEHL